MWGILGLNLNGMMKSSSSSNNNNNNASIETLTLNQLSALQIKLKNHLPQIVPFSYKLSWPSHSSMLVLIFDWKRHRYIDRKKKYFFLIESQTQDLLYPQFKFNPLPLELGHRCM